MYRGARPLLPLLACRVRLETDRQSVDYIDRLSDGWNWRTVPFKEIGKDNAGNIICCVAHGRYGPMYQRALTGIADLFQLDTQIIDVDAIISEKASSHLWIATCLECLSWPTSFWHARRLEIINVIRQHVAGSG